MHAESTIAHRRSCLAELGPLLSNVGDAVLEVTAGLCRRPGTASSSESGYSQSPSEPANRAARAHGEPADRNSDVSSEATNKKDEKQRVPFLYDNITPPSLFRGEANEQHPPFIFRLFP